MTTISIIIDGPQFNVKADFSQPAPDLVKDEEAVHKLGIECMLVKEFMPRIKSMAENVLMDFRRRSELAQRQERRVNEIKEIIPFPAPEATAESSDLQPDA